MKTSGSIELMYVGSGANWRVEIYTKWVKVDHARVGTRRMLKHLKSHGFDCHCVKGVYEPFAGTFDVIVSVDTSDVYAVKGALER